jgi:hypothetical protein
MKLNLRIKNFARIGVDGTTGDLQLIDFDIIG